MVLQTLGQSPQLGNAAAKDLPEPRPVKLPGVGHIPHPESPDKSHAALLDFLKAR
jgi:pimeloyl-ACP methyl ester carboxylesterase